MGIRMENVIIKTENLGFTYIDDEDESPLVKEKEIPALDGVSLEIKEGEYIAVLGHNGSGKSTFAKLLNLILTPTVGKIYIDGVDITKEDFTERLLFSAERAKPVKIRQLTGKDNALVSVKQPSAYTTLFVVISPIIPATKEARAEIITILDET